MECPVCGKPMEEGYLSSKGPVFWSEEVSGFSLPTRSGDVLLGKAMGLLRPKAYLCRNCRTVTVKYLKTKETYKYKRRRIMDYNKTINLPKTDFPMRAGLPKREPEMLKRWEDMDLYNELLKKN